MKSLLLLFSRRWILATLLALVASGVMARLGIWQLDRLAARRLFNERALEWAGGPVLIMEVQAMSLDLYNMEYRPVEISGQYVLEDQVALKNQQNGTQLGVALMTPVLIEDASEAILVLRGWIPQADAGRESWSRYDLPGVSGGKGVLRRSQPQADFGNLVDPTLAPGELRLDLWYSANVERIAEQSSVPLRPDVYVQLLPGEAQQGVLPAPQPLDLEISEGPHMGYALQWFSFALILLLGYPVYVTRDESRRRLQTDE